METLINKFYHSFAQFDADGMESCYHKNILFSDPAFGTLRGKRASNMWRMLLNSQKDKNFKISFSDIKIAGDYGSAHWEAEYIFSKTGRKVHNIIEARFKFEDGKIIEHRDNFNLYNWSKQALGLSGYLIGWTYYFRKKLQEQTNSVLDRYEKSIS